MNSRNTDDDNNKKKDSFPIQKHILKLNHFNDNDNLKKYKAQFQEHVQRLENLNNDTVTFNTDDDAEESIQVRTPNLETHIVKALDTLSNGLQGKFEGACLSWVEKERKAAGIGNVVERAERYLRLYEEMVERLQRLDWEILEAEEWEERMKGEDDGGGSGMADKDGGGRDEGDGAGKGIGSGDRNGSGGNGSHSAHGKNGDGEGDETHTAEGEKGDEAEKSERERKVERNGRGRNIWTEEELLEESTLSYQDVTVQTVPDENAVPHENCAAQ